MRPYLDLMRHVLEHGTRKIDRTGTGTLSVFGWQMRFDLAQGFPLLTTKKLHLQVDHPRTAVVPAGRHQHPLPEGKRRLDLGRLGRRQRRPRPGLRLPVALLARGRRPRHRPDRPAGRRPEEESGFAPPHRQRLEPGRHRRMKLPPCHALFQFYVADGKLSCQLYQRSADIFLGVPFNIASYALLTLMLAQVCGYRPGDFRAHPRRRHLYTNHLEQARLQLTREPRAAAAAAHQPGGERTSSPSASRTSRSKATTRIRTSPRRWPCD
jgi:thymidylate synthase